MPRSFKENTPAELKMKGRGVVLNFRTLLILGVFSNNYSVTNKDMQPVVKSFLAGLPFSLSAAPYKEQPPDWDSFDLLLRRMENSFLQSACPWVGDEIPVFVAGRFAQVTA